MDTAQLTKIIGGALGLVCVMLLAMTGKIDGPTAMTSVTAIVGVFLAGTAVLGAAKTIGTAMRARVPAAPPPPAPAATPPAKP